MAKKKATKKKASKKEAEAAVDDKPHHISHHSHEDLHDHVEPDTHHSEVPDGHYHPSGDDHPELKSRLRLDWIWTKIRIGKFHPFPLMMILMLGVPIFFVILGGLGVETPFTVVELPIIEDIMEYMGIYSDKDLLVIATWVLWWPIFIVTIFIFKRIWCGGFCPFGLMTDIGNFFGKKLRRGQLPKPINVTKYIFIGFLVFKALGYLHDAINITNSAVLSVEFVVFFIVYSFIIGMMAPRRTFCRVFCFLGSLPHLFGRLSIYTLETDRSKCEKCEGQWCLTGYHAKPYGIAKAREPLLNLDGCPMFINVPQLSHNEPNRNCILCGNCVKNCPYDAIHYKPKVPGYELYKGIDLNIHETVFVLGLVPLLAMFVAMEGGMLGKFAQSLLFVDYLQTTQHWAITALFFILATVLFCFGYYLVSGLSAKVLNIDFKKAFVNFGYVYLPFGYMAFVRDIVITYALKGSFVPVQFPLIVLWYPFLDIPLLIIGIAWSIYMAKKISQVSVEQAGGEQNEQRVLVSTLLHSVFVIAVGWFWFDQVLPEYMHLLAAYKIHYIWPFVLSGALLVLWWGIAKLMKLFKKEEPQPTGA